MMKSSRAPTPRAMPSHDAPCDEMSAAMADVGAIEDVTPQSFAARRIGIIRRRP